MIKHIRLFLIMAVFITLAIPAIVTAGTVNLPRTGQATCYDTAGNAIACAGTGQDGDIQAGVAWPSPRFTNNGDGTVTDKLTGLMWTQDAKTPGPVDCSPATTKTWQEALDYVACLNTNGYLGYSDWKLPNINELESLINAESSTSSWLNTQGFTNVQVNYYWSSTSYAYIANGNAVAWAVGMWNGAVYNVMKSGSFSTPYYVWPVRVGQSGLVHLWKTGQAACYDSAGNVIACAGTGQDGEIQAGVPWSNPRFTVGAGIEADCVTDNLTGLMWTKNAHLSGSYLNWQQALDYANNLTLCGYSDWRLPNRKELMSLIDRSKVSPALPAGHPFINVQGDARWSSTTGPSKNNAYTVGMSSGVIDILFTSSYYYLYTWPVRGTSVSPSVHSILGRVTDNSTGLGGVTMTLSGTASATTTTAGDGTYSFPNLSDGNYTITPGQGCCTFSPASRPVTVAGADITGQDFSVSNHAPVLDPIGAKTDVEGSLLTITLTGSDQDVGDTLTYSASNLPTGAAFDPSTRLFSWTPGLTQSGLYSVTFSVSDGSLTDSEDVTITVNADTTPPTGSIVINSNRVYTNTAAVTLRLSCTDPSPGSGCTQMQLSNDGVFDTEPWEPYITSKSWNLLPRDGINKRVYVQYKDNAGNVSPIYFDTIKLDTTPPVVSSVSDTPDPFNASIGETSDISFTVSDKMSGTCRVMVRIYNASSALIRTIYMTGVPCPSAGATGFVTWDGRNSSGVIVRAGTYTYKVQAIDNALNWSVIGAGAVGTTTVQR
ncbi:MAG: DUF1566 domain-containing protein [Nitrospira sp.]|nr:DUF1566 domain-containing protein [Nitrospira sp.]